MGLRDDIQADVAEAFDADLSDAVRDFNGSREEAGEYDPATGETTTTLVEYEGRGVFGGYDAQEIDGQHILQTDRKLTALQNEVTGTPEVGDDVNGFEVMHVGQDPASSIWILQLRRT